MITIRSTRAVLVSLALSACGVAGSDPSLWQQTKDLGRAQLQLPSPNGMAGASPANGAGGDTSTGASSGTGNAPAAGNGGSMGVGTGGAMQQFPSGAGGFGAGGVGARVGAGGLVGAGGGIGAGGGVGAGGAKVDPTGNSGQCTFSFDVTTVTANGMYAPRNVGAIWITDSQNKFVKTLREWGSAQRIVNATPWTQSTGSNETDAVTGATRPNHGSLNATWNCTDLSKSAVMDGQYSVNVTFAESDTSFFFFGGGLAQAAVPFTKGPGGTDVMGQDTANFKAMHVKLTIP